MEYSSQQLKQYLEQGKSIITTTIQKFPVISDEIAALGDKTFAVIIDEVHSSQSGERSKELKKALSKPVEVDGEFDYEDALRQVVQSRGEQKHISFFGFTGTPTEATLELFGRKVGNDYEPFHLYSMKQSIYEGFTLNVLDNYITYKRYFNLIQNTLNDKEVPVDKASKELIKYVDKHPKTIAAKVSIMLNHWVEKGSKEIGGRSRAMIVTPSRQHCVDYFREVNRQLRERKLGYSSLVAFSGEVADTASKDNFTEASLNREIGSSGDVALALKDPKYRLLIVANKYQTGFDEPLMQTMYVDKKMEGVQCVQTLSRLNRTANGKTQTFVLDFVNEVEEVRESFQRFYQSTIMEGESDPNKLYELKSGIYAYHLFTDEDVNGFCKIFYDADQDDNLLHPVLDRVVEKFSDIGEKEDKEIFRSKVKSYIRAYGYLSQIINFVDIDLEKYFVFLTYLNKKLPKVAGEIIDFTGTVDLASLRVQITQAQMQPLEAEDAKVNPREFGELSKPGEERDLLSSIIRKINTMHGIGLDEEGDKLYMATMQNELRTDDIVRKVMSDRNTEEHKFKVFKERFDKILHKAVEERIDFFKKVDSPGIREFLCREMYEDYKLAAS